MNNEKYLVSYRVMEGNNYAGGWGKRTKIVDDIGDAEGIGDIDKIEPITIGGPIPNDTIETEFRKERERKTQEELQREIDWAEKKLVRLYKRLRGGE